MFKRIVLSLIGLLLVCGTSFADDDHEKENRDNKNERIKFIYNKMDVGGGAVESGHYFTGPSGMIYLFPYWAQPTPRPTPVPTPTPKPTVTPVPTPTPKPTVTPVPTPVPTPIPTITPAPKIPNKENAFNSCMQCHKKTDAKYNFVNWTDSLHKKVGHQSRTCSSCHNIL